MTAQIENINGRPMVALSPEAMEHLKATEGAQVEVVLSPNGVEIVADSELARQLEIARGVMRDDRDALSELAK